MPALSKKKMYRGRKFVKRTIGYDGWLTNPRGLRKWLGFKRWGSYA